MIKLLKIKNKTFYKNSLLKFGWKFFFDVKNVLCAIKLFMKKCVFLSIWRKHVLNAKTEKKNNFPNWSTFTEFSKN